MRNLLLLVGALLLFVVPFDKEINAQAQEPPSISDFTNCVSFFSRRVTAREGNCRFWEFEVVIDGGGGQGPPGPQGPQGVAGTDGVNGADGAPGNDGEDGIDVTAICANQEVLLADGTCLDIYSLFSCPCFDASDVPSRGIDVLPEVLQQSGLIEVCVNDEVSGNTRLAGLRTGELTDVYLAAVLDVQSTSQAACSFQDLGNETQAFITAAEAESCRRIILNSQMWALNCNAE